MSSQPFKLVHLRLYFTNEKNHQTHICGNDRVVESLSLSKRIPDLNAVLVDEDNNVFKYAACLTSEYLDDHVNVERAGFNIPRFLIAELIGESTDPSSEFFRSTRSD